MDVKDLRYFVAVYETRGFSRASECLGTVQSNVSSRIRGLEEWLGAPLFERHYRRRVVPTERGIKLYAYAKIVIAALDNIEREIGLARARAAASYGALPVNKGFTLLELLIVVAVIALLAGYVAPHYFTQLAKSETQMVRAQIDALEKALDQYRLDVRSYPTSEQGLSALVQRPQNEARWNGPYLKKAVPVDPWGRQYVYRHPGTDREYDLLSHGRDGVPGGAGENSDISNY